MSHPSPAPGTSVSPRPSAVADAPLGTPRSRFGHRKDSAGAPAGTAAWLWRWVRPHRRFLVPGIGLIALQAGVEVSLPLFFGRGVIDHTLLGVGDTRLLAFYVAGALLLMLVKGLFSYGQLYYLHRVGQGAIADLRAALHDHMLRLPLSYFERRRSGELVSRLTSDIAVIQQTVTAGISTGFHQVLSLVGIIALLLYLEWKLALISFVTLPAAAWAVDRFGSRVRANSAKLQGRIAEMAALLAESLGAMRVVKAFSMEEAQRRRFQAENQRSFHASMKSAQAMATVTPVVELILVAGMVVVLWFGGRAVMQGALTVGELISFLAYLGMATRPVNAITKHYSLLQQALAAAGRLREVLAAEVESQPESGAIKLPRLRGEVTMEGVSFAYEGGRKVLRDINLRIRPGEVVALVGPSGAGKTTLMQLVPRFYDPQEGTVRVDGYDLRQVDIRSLRDQIALVPQDTVLFAVSIAENIAAGRDGVTREQIEEAARLANAHDFIVQLPDGYDSVVGERGLTLSGGQRQRIAIARAILGDPRILLMDEATSALDSESERLIREALERIRGDRTIIIIAHRPSTVQAADRILVMDGGRIVQEGTHSELMAQPGLYRRLYAQGLGSGERLWA